MKAVGKFNVKICLSSLHKNLFVVPRFMHPIGLSCGAHSTTQITRYSSMVHVLAFHMIRHCGLLVRTEITINALKLVRAESVYPCINHHVQLGKT